MFAVPSWKKWKKKMENKARARERSRRYDENHREERRRKWREYKNLNPQVYNPGVNHAREILRTAVRYGKIEKPKECQKCGRAGLLHGHHEDYNKPLEVIWLCSICHGKRHRKLSEEGEA